MKQKTQAELNGHREQPFLIFLLLLEYWEKKKEG